MKELREEGKKFKENDCYSLSEWLLDKYHIVLVPGIVFGTPGYLRMSYSVSEEDLKAGVLQMKAAFSEIS